MGNKDLQSCSKENKRLIHKAKSTMTFPDVEGGDPPPGSTSSFLAFSTLSKRWWVLVPCQAPRGPICSVPDP